MIADAADLAARYPAGGPGRPIAWIDTPLGGMVAVTSPALSLLEFHDRRELFAELAQLGPLRFGRDALTEQLSAQLAAYFAGTDARFTVPLAPEGTDFQRSVWQALLQVPPGETRSYGRLAADLGNPKAVRAVGRANGANRIALVIPCHRIVGSGGALTGYAGGLSRKQALIRHETDRFSGQAGLPGLLDAWNPGEKA